MDGWLVIFEASPGSIDELCLTVCIIGNTASNAAQDLDRLGAARTEKVGRQRFALIDLNMRSMGK